ncbi:aspartate aminotransferase family protein [Mangrovibacterium diazotrophicum]|uniref:4-aminobutyrate aminotransferase n=1 Tax=Mangrovibacterium diazotrophicum TaxID=1261403 RepID=A0A419VYG3_9BACT|nr:aspartate aminotransferase family protein [Mangrovibacterium diazotrophicum]RKD88252.1 4-aminobutyrate aminotransferase [Mangrovibacterium diazotrophicum]
MEDKILRVEGDINLTEGRKVWMTELADETVDLLHQDAGAFIHQALSTPCLDVLDRVEGSYLITTSGKKILDFHGNNLHQLGHGNREVVEAVSKMMHKLPFSPRRYTNRVAIELAERLTSLAPGLNRVLFAPGGSEANSMALKLARIATGKFKVVSMWGAFHGGGLDTISVGGEAPFRKGIGPLMTGVQHVPQPEFYRQPWKDDPDQNVYVELIRQVFENEGDVGALIAETVRNTDVQIPSKNFWQKIRALCDEYGVVLILDEIPIAMGRTGKFFAFEHYGITPDIVTIGKALGGGVFPMAAVLTNDRFNGAAEHSVGHFTHEKSPLGSAAGLAVLNFIEKESIVARANELGALMQKRLLEMKERYEIIGDVRGIGLLWGVDLVTDRETKERAFAEGEKVMYDCLKNGLSFKVSQGSVINLCPPITISQEELEQALGILENAIIKVNK